jgi:hypothetical protein
MKKQVNLMGVPITIASDKEAEECDFLVCMPVGASPFDDNLTGFCWKCGVKLMYRWHAPRKPKRICLDCMVKMEMDGSK